MFSISVATLTFWHVKHFFLIYFFSPVFSGQSVKAANEKALAYMKSRVGGMGGVVTVDPQGHWDASFSSLQMAWAAAQKDTLHYGLYTGEHFTQSIDWSQEY